MIWAWQASQIMCGVEGAAAAACGSTSGGGAPRPVRGGGGAAGGGGTTHCGETEQRWHTVQNGAMKPCSVRGSRSVIRTYAAPTHRTGVYQGHLRERKPNGGEGRRTTHLNVAGTVGCSRIVLSGVACACDVCGVSTIR